MYAIASADGGEPASFRGWLFTLESVDVDEAASLRDGAGLGEARRVGDDGRGSGVLDHGGQALLGRREIERHVGGSGLEDTEDGA